MKISSAEFVRNYGQIADKALSEPVTITRNGHERLVLLSIDEYNRLRGQDRVAYRMRDLPSELVDAIRTAEPPVEAAAFDHEYDASKAR
jgi:prevent-host-death family protein